MYGLEEKKPKKMTGLERMLELRPPNMCEPFSKGGRCSAALAGNPRICSSFVHWGQVWV